MSDRETKTIQTPIGKDNVTIKTYLTAKEEMEIQKILFDSAEISGGVVTNMSGSKSEVMFGMEKKLMEIAVVKINDDNKDIVNRLLDMRANDYNFVKEEIDKIRVSENVKKN